MAKDLQPYGADQELLEDLADRIDAADALAELGSGPGMPWRTSRPRSTTRPGGGRMRRRQRLGSGARHADTCAPPGWPGFYQR